MATAIVPFDYVNDGYADCEDGSDEPTYDFEELSVFVCDDGSEIPLSNANDGYADCAEDEDEPDVVEENAHRLRVGRRDSIVLGQRRRGRLPRGRRRTDHDPITQSETSTFRALLRREHPAFFCERRHVDYEDYEDEPYYDEYDQNGYLRWNVIPMRNDGYEDCADGSEEPTTWAKT